MELRKEVNGKTIFYKKPKQPSYQEIVLGLNRMEIPPEWEIYVAYILSDRKLT
jgi:DNA topoisomerase IB